MLVGHCLQLGRDRIDSHILALRLILEHLFKVDVVLTETLEELLDVEDVVYADALLLLQEFNRQSDGHWLVLHI